MASGKLKLTLTGHIEQVRGKYLMILPFDDDCIVHFSIFMQILNCFLYFPGLAVSSKHTYMFSAGDDKQVKCWDLEQNKVIFHLKEICVIRRELL